MIALTAFFTVLIALLSLIAIFLFLKISVNFKFNNEIKEELKIRVYLYNKKIGFDIKKKQKKEKDKKLEKNSNKKEKGTILERLYNLYTELQKMKYTYILSKEFLRKRLVLKNIEANVDFGLSDAAKTGIATGAVWTFIYNVFGFITRIFTVENHKFNVKPDYNNEKFFVSIDGILTFRIANIISIALYLLIKYITVSKKYEQNLKESV